MEFAESQVGVGWSYYYIALLGSLVTAICLGLALGKPKPTGEACHGRG